MVPQTGQEVIPGNRWKQVRRVGQVTTAAVILVILGECRHRAEETMAFTIAFLSMAFEADPGIRSVMIFFLSFVPFDKEKP
jgi:hypothetical protein